MKIFIMAGQSNMVGTCNPKRVTSKINGVTLFGNNAFKNYKIPEDLKSYYNIKKVNFNDFKTFGPDYFLAKKLKNDLNKFTIVKIARNGTSLLAWDKEWNKDVARITDNSNDGPLYDLLLKTTNNVGGEVQGIFWMQGERDCLYEKAACQYESNFIKLINNMRNDFGKNIPFIFGRVTPPLRYKFRNLVRNAQEKSANMIDLVKMVDTNDIAMKDDNLHHSFEGMKALAGKFYLAYKG